MAGRIIGLIPVNFVIVLLENHIFYDENAANKEGKAVLARQYVTAVSRQDSAGGNMSQKVYDENKSDEGHSPRGSIADEDDNLFVASPERAKSSDIDNSKAKKDQDDEVF